MRMIKTVLLLLLAILISGMLVAVEYSLKNRFVAYFGGYPEGAEEKGSFYLQWIPTVNYSITEKSRIRVLGETAFEGKISTDTDDLTDNSIVKGGLYRCWLKTGTYQTEIRLGLQKLNFGSAQILRPLQWFDNLDPRDVSEQTKGVQAALFRHYFRNNANLWLWGIRGDGKMCGISYLKSREGSAEFGGRLQHPIYRGDAALSFHHREETEVNGDKLGAEDKIGFDLRTDTYVGLWLENSLARTEKPQDYAKWQHGVTAGADYTAGIGNGLYLLLEHNLLQITTGRLDKLMVEFQTTALMLSYPLSFLDNVLFYGILTDEGETMVSNFIWRRTYDRLSWNCGISWDAGKWHKMNKARAINILIAYVF